MATLGQVIRLRRSELGLTQEELAGRVGEGVRQAEISRLERDGVALPRRQRLEQLARALDMPLGVLLARSGWSGAEVEFPLESPELHGQDSGPAVVEHATTPNPDEPRVATGVDVPLLHDAISRAEEVRRHTATVIQKAQITYNQAQRSMGDRRRRNEKANPEAKS